MNLPVNPTQVDTRWFVHNVPQQFPPLPQVPVPGSIGNGVSYVLGLLALQVQQNAGGNAPRTFFANLITRNNWQNPESQLLVATVFEVVDYAIQTARAPLEQVVQDAVEMTVRMMVAFYASQFQEGLAPYVQPGLGQQLNDSLNQLHQMRQQIQQFYQAQSARPNGYYGGGYNTGGPGMSYNQQPTLLGAGPLSNMQRFEAPARNTTSHMSSGFPPMGRPSNDGLGMPISGRFGTSTLSPSPAPATRMEEIWDRTPPRSEVTEVAEVRASPAQNPRVVFAKPTPPPPGNGRQPVFVEVKDPRDTAPQTFREYHVASAPAPAPTQTPKRMSDGHVITDPSDPYKEITFADGSVLRRAAESGWTKDWTTKQPYHLAYNPETHVLFHLKTNDGLVHETVIERTKLMEQYVDHELNPTLKAAEESRLAAQKGKSLVDWTRMVNLTPEAEKPFALPSPAPTEETTFSDMPIRKIEKVISATDVRSAEAAAMVQYPELMRASKKDAVEFYCEATTPRLTHSDLYAAIDELVQSHTYATAIDNLQKARSKFPEDVALWDEIDQRLTATVNRFLKVGFALDWTIDTFSEDADELTEALRETYGDDVATAYSELAMRVIDLSINIAQKDAITRLAADEGTEVQDVHENPIVAFTNRISVTKIPYTFEELSISFNTTSAVTRDGLPELYKVIDAIFSRTEDFPVCFAWRFLKTSDNVWIALDHALLLENAYLVTRHTF